MPKGTRPRERGTNLRQRGMSPRQLGKSPRQIDGREPRPKRARVVYASGEERRKGVPAKLRFFILKRDGFRCRYCGVGSDKSPLQVDHVHPKSLGGDLDPSNLVTACADCNVGKSDLLLEGGAPSCT